MAIYSLQVKTISRSDGRSVVAAAAYRAGEKLIDDRLGVVWDFTARRDVLHSEIMAPAGAPPWAQDRQYLWNAAEAAEDKSTRRATATTGRDIILALPHELTHEQRLAASREFAAALIQRYGVVVDFALHGPPRYGDPRNFHGHFLMSTRCLGPEGFGKKTRQLDGFRNGSAEIEVIRELWENIGNRALEAAGLDIRIDRRSYVDQGLDREATVHLGPVASGLERKGEGTDLGDRNRGARKRNAERERLAAERARVSAKIIDLAAEREKRAEERELRAAIKTYDPGKILDLITRRRSTFDRADLNRLLGQVIFDGQARAALTNRILARHEVLGLSEEEGGPIERYTTRQVLADEAEALREAKALSAKHGFAIARATGEVVLRDLRLNGEQKAAFRHAVGASGFAMIVGEAGTGKSTALAAIRDAYQAEGYRVVGMAWTNAVVQDMRRDGFEHATTIASELQRASRGQSDLDQRSVVLIDEAAMLSTKHLAAIIRHTRAAGAKLVLAGDDRQLASIERGGLFGALRNAHDAAELHEVVRVADPEHRRAFNLMHERDFRTALGIYAGQDVIRWRQTQTEALGALVVEWGEDLAADPAKTRFVFAYTNMDVMALNAALRDVWKEQRALGPDHELQTADGPSAFAVGERIQFTGSAWHRRARDAGLANGSVGTVEEIEGRRVTVRLDGNPGEERAVSFIVGNNYRAGEFDTFRHGYAGTIYKGQGRTLDAAYLYHSHHWRSASSYVALTRHREDVKLFAALETAADLNQIARQMARVDENRAASQFYVVGNDNLPPGGGSETPPMSDATDNIPEDELTRQARREADVLREMALEGVRLTVRRDREADALREREAAQLGEREAESYRQAAEVERRMEEFRRAKDREAEEARREAQQRETAARVQAQQGEVADAGNRYAQALGQHYDIADPYHSLARAAMAEYGAFHREQDRLKREIAVEANADKRQLLELRKEIEAVDYMAITSRRLTVISRVVTGRDDSEQANRDEARYEEFAARSRELRQHYRELLEERLTRDAAREDRNPEPGGADERRPQQDTGRAGQTQRSRTRGKAGAARSTHPDQPQEQDSDGPRVVAGVVRDPRRERQQREADTQRRGQEDAQGTQARAPSGRDGDTTQPSAAALARIRKQRERYEALAPKREQARQTGRSRGGPSR